VQILVNLATFRTLTRLAAFVAVVLVTVGIYQLLPPGSNWRLALVLVLLGAAIVALATRLAVRPDPAGERLFVLVSKSDCLLCSEAKLRLAALLDGREFQVQEVRIEDDEALRRQYADWVPVLLWQHEEIAKGRWDWPLIEEIVTAVEEGRDPSRPSKPYQVPMG
jgi:hypothetical protein